MRYIFLFLSIFFFSNNASTQIHEPVKWKLDSEHLNGDEYLLTFQANIDAPWTVYSQYTSDDGPVPTSINYESEGFEKIGQAVETGHKKEGFDKLFETDVIKFLADQPFVIKQKVKAASGTTVSGYLTYMTCDSEKCLPPTDVDFSFKLENKSNTKAVEIKNEAAPGNTKTKVITVPSSTKGISVSSTEGIKINTGSTNATANTPSGNKTTGIVNEVSGLTVKADKINEIIKEVKEPETTETEMLEPVKWDVAIKPLANDEYELKYTATIDKGWNVYSQFTSDDGPFPTAVTYETEGVTLLGKGTEEGHKKEGYDKMFDTDVIKFLADQPYTIIHKIKASGVDQMKGYLTYMTCDDEKCLPPSDVEFGFDLKSGSVIPYSAVGSDAVASAGAASASNGALIENGFIDNRIPQLSASYKSPVSNCGDGEEEASNSLLMTFIFGFLGGLIALLTPCVFPMIPLTVSFFTKDTKRKGWVNGLIYGLCIIAIYVSLGMGLTMVFGEEALNRLSVSWIANTLFFLIFLFFAFSFFGYYEITLPSSWTTKTDGMADKGGLLGIFFMAFTLALVSFSCTGPIIGSAIVSAASTGSKLGPAIVMGGFALGLALPFGVFAAIPALLNSLPRSGGWMNSVKVVLGFLELALAFKFLSVADLTNHWGFLRYELFMAIWVLCFAGMTAYLFGLIKFPHDSPIKKLSPFRTILAVASLAFTLYLATGFFVNPETNSYKSKAAMSGLAPPSSYNYFLKNTEVDKDIKAKYPSYTMCANDIPCFKDYYEGKAYAESIKKPVFLDFTGHGCVNCRKTEELIWVEDEVRNKLINDWVLVSLYVDDDKKLDNVYVSKTRDKKIRNVGNMWADFQILNFDQNSQPLYVMMTTDEKVLAKPRGFKTGVKDYLEYMDCGYQAYESLEK